MNANKLITCLGCSILLIVVFSVLNSLAFPKHRPIAKHSKSIEKNSEPSKISPLTSFLLQSALNIHKPKTYDKIIKEAVKQDKHPQFVSEFGSQHFALRKSGRGFMKSIAKKWKYEMFVVIDSTIPDKKRYEIETAIFTLKAAMKCFKFKVIRNGTLPSTMDHLHIKASDPQFPNTECGSYLGRVGGEQITVISDKCRSFMGVTMHEVMHVLGFYHEHTRPDRDKYVKVNWDDIPDQWAPQYVVRNDQTSIKEYDFGSIMHYPVNAFMEPKVELPPDVIPGQRSGLSELDKRRLQRAYPC